MELKRNPNNPILEPDKKIWWRKEAVFNCAAETYKGKIILLTRCVGEYEKYISRIGYAESKNGINFKQNKNPFIAPSKKYDQEGCEDPKITKIGDKYYITYVALEKPAHKGGGPPRIALASTKDFKTYRKHGIITPIGADVRDSSLFSRKINGEYVMLHRPFNWTKKDITKSKRNTYVNVKGNKIKWPKELDVPNYFPKKPSIWVCFSKDLKNWYGHKVVIEPKYKWENEKIGGGVPPLETNDGWLLIYHGVQKRIKKRKYHIGAALLNLGNLELISRTGKPLLAPERWYEKKGHVNDVIFPGGLILKGNKLYLYYGGGDSYCCLATIELNKLLNSLRKL